ncbi:MAG: NAD(P)-dependent oxidoreductase [Burkholderiales bacterium]|nr:NAD(P)-dependent oxidoreductase [Burkholderiales bacterium]
MIKRLLITGASGAIGSCLRAEMRNAYALVRLSDVRPLPAPVAVEECIRADLGNFEAVASLMQDIDCVIHLGGVPKEDSWNAILEHNIVGTYNVFEAARQAGVKRVIYASSNHVIGYYRADKTIGVEEPPRPDSRYGVSKVFGEALGRLYADKHGLSVACLRIGSFRERPQNVRQLATWISPRDMVHLVRCCIDAPDYRFLVLYGVSNNDRNRWRNPAAAVIGYQPQDNAEAHASEFQAPRPDGTDPSTEFHGGEFCSIEFTNIINKIE